MIKEISIRNFKSIQNIQYLRLKPLTVLTGVNSSGKSSIMEAISSFAQASRLIEIHARECVTPSMIFSQGDVRRYPHELEDFISYKKKSNRLVVLEIHLKPKKRLVDNIRKLLDEKRGAEPGLDRILRNVFLDEKKPKIETVGYSFSFQSTKNIFMQTVFVNKKTLISVAQIPSDPATRIVVPDEYKNVQMSNTAMCIFDERVFKSAATDALLSIVEKLALLVLKYVQNHAQKIYFISGERGRIEPQSFAPSRGREPESAISWIGPNGQYLIEILSRCMTREPEKAQKIREWAEKFQLPDVRAGYIGRGILESNFTDKTLGVSLNTNLAGLGSRQILAIITQIFWSEPESVVMIEEPEISLHPENQVLLHELFSEAISQGKQIVCSTHSPFFVLALSKIIRKKLLALNDIAVYHIEKNKQGTRIRQLKLNKHGFIVAGVPSFMKVEGELFHDWSESLEEE
jgi:predicted ATPase